MQKLDDILLQVKALCQDLSQDVRYAICDAVLQPLAKAVGPSRATHSLLEEAVELVQVRPSACCCAHFVHFRHVAIAFARTASPAVLQHQWLLEM